MIKQFLTDVVWGTRDYLIIDTPPGTSDEHITIVEQLKAIKPDGAVLVSTPQVGLNDTLPLHNLCGVLTFNSLALGQSVKQRTHENLRV